MTKTDLSTQPAMKPVTRQAIAKLAVKALTPRLSAQNTASAPFPIRPVRM